MNRIGILGGTFSPPHIGHLAMARAAKNGLLLDKIIFIPCGEPPHKDKNLVWDSALRLRLTKALVAHEENMTVSDIEIRFEGKSYTAKTLSYLKKEDEENHFFFIVGADSLCYMDKWMTPEIIFKNAEIAVLDREGYSDRNIDEYASFLKEKYDAKIHRIKMKRLDVSSSMLRNMLDKNEDISAFTGKEIYDMILEHKNGDRKNY